ncbi:MAG: histidine kinase [Acidobacteria bacterium]|nr:histidine kinase [Acidobacteriota bacterium]
MGRSWRRVTAYLIPWTVVGIFFSGQIYLNYLYAGQALGWREALYLGLSEWYIWAGLSPALFYLARAFPLSRGYWGRSLSVHIPATFGITIAKLALHAPLVAFSGIPPLREAGLKTTQLSILTCWMIAGVCHAVLHYRTSQDRLKKSLELEASLATARLQLLRIQLQPHFLFNTLHSISSLMHSDLELAQKVLVKLGDLLRMTLENHEVQEVPLSTEMAATRLYLEIQRIRFRDRLQVQYSLEPEAMEMLVPTMILQPLVENAVIHGIEKRMERGEVSISASVRQGHLCLEVVNDMAAPGESDPARSGDGIGLTNTRNRLQTLYGDDARLTVERMQGERFRVSMVVPLRREEDRDEDGE